MRVPLTSAAWRRIFRWKVPRRFRQPVPLLTLILLVPAVAFAQSGSPFDTGFTALQTLFTGTIAKVASLIAIVIGGYQFAHGEPGAKKALAGVAAGSGIAVLAVNVLSWLWGI
jgi:type IV secretion system protein VirB2